MLKDRVTLQHEMIRKQDKLIQEKHEKQIMVSFNIISLKWSVYVYQSILPSPSPLSYPTQIIHQTFYYLVYLP